MNESDGAFLFHLFIRPGKNILKLVSFSHESPDKESSMLVEYLQPKLSLEA
jgi:hypothetical protein